MCECVHSQGPLSPFDAPCTLLLALIFPGSEPPRLASQPLRTAHSAHSRRASNCAFVVCTQGAGQGPPGHAYVHACNHGGKAVSGTHMMQGACPCPTDNGRRSGSSVHSRARYAHVGERGLVHGVALQCCVADHLRHKDVRQYTVGSQYLCNAFQAGRQASASVGQRKAATAAHGQQPTWNACRARETSSTVSVHAT